MFILFLLWASKFLTWRAGSNLLHRAWVVAILLISLELAPAAEYGLWVAVTLDAQWQWRSVVHFAACVSGAKRGSEKSLNHGGQACTCRREK
jgi:hypothetical protein